MRWFVLVAVALAGLGAACLGGSSQSSGGRSQTAPTAATHVEVAYFAALRRACPAGVHCITMPVQRTACPAEAQCTPPKAGAQLIRCPGRADSWVHCYALRASGSGRPAWLILQQRELWCTPARGGYGNPEAACSALADYVRLTRKPQGVACSCPVELWPGSATGVFRGRNVSLDLSICTACSLGASAGADRQTLEPHLGAA